MKSIKIIYLLLCSGTLLTSCTKSSSLQSYYVDKMEDASFLIINLPFQLESLFDQDLSEQEQMIVSSIEKLNLLLYLPKEKQKEKEKQKAYLGIM